MKHLHKVIILWLHLQLSQYFILYSVIEVADELKPYFLKLFFV